MIIFRTWGFFRQSSLNVQCFRYVTLLWFICDLIIVGRYPQNRSIWKYLIEMLFLPLSECLPPPQCRILSALFQLWDVWGFLACTVCFRHPTSSVGLRSGSWLIDYDPGILFFSGFSQQLVDLLALLGHCHVAGVQLGFGFPEVAQEPSG